VLTCGIAVGCVLLRGPVEGAFTVRGTIANAKEQSDCVLQLFRVDGEAKLLRKIPVSRNIDRTILSDPNEATYFMEITCSDTAGAFRTQEYRISGTKYKRSPIELGEIVLR
jgi:hypothetical protein